MARTLLLVIIGIGLTPLRTEAACPFTIPELVRMRRPEPVERYRTREIVAVPFASIVAKADLVVDGQVRKVRTYLTEDQCFLYTDYEIRVNNLVSGTLAAAKTPGPQPLVVRIPGGETTIDGVKVIARDEPLPPFDDGELVVLFLSRTQDGRAFELAEGPFGAFAVKNGRMKRLLRASGIPDDFPEAAKATFVQEIRRLKASR